MEEYIRLIVNSNITWATACVLIAFAFRSVPGALIELNKLRIQERSKLEQNRIDAERDQTRVLESLKDELATGRGVYQQVITSINAIPTTLEAMQRQNGVLHDDLKTVPSEVWRLGDPKLLTMKTGIEDRITRLQASIEDRLPANATNARDAIRFEFETMNKRLDDLTKTLQTFSTKPPAPVTGAMTDKD